jgi:hypothetical protein
MKTKILSRLLAGCLLALAVWLVHVPTPAQAGEVPEKYRETVQKGLEFLAKNQAKDGHWEGDGGKHPVAITSLAGMALLMEGSNVQEGKYRAHISKAVDWLVARSEARRDGLIFSDHPSETDRYMYGHGLATEFLGWAYAKEIDAKRNEKLDQIILRAVKYILKARSSEGGWYRTAKIEGHDFSEILATAIQTQALCAAGKHGFFLRGAALEDGWDYLEKMLARLDEGAKPAQNRSKQAEAATALPCLIWNHKRWNEESCKKWYKYCQSEIPVGRAVKFGRDELTHYYYAQGLFIAHKRGKDFAAWTDYRTAMFDHLQARRTRTAAGRPPRPPREERSASARSTRPPCGARFSSSTKTAIPWRSTPHRNEGSHHEIQGRVCSAGRLPA